MVSIEVLLVFYFAGVNQTPFLHALFAQFERSSYVATDDCYLFRNVVNHSFFEQTQICEYLQPLLDDGLDLVGFIRSENDTVLAHSRRDARHQLLGQVQSIRNSNDHQFTLIFNSCQLFILPS